MHLPPLPSYTQPEHLRESLDSIIRSLAHIQAIQPMDWIWICDQVHNSFASVSQEVIAIEAARLSHSLLIHTQLYQTPLWNTVFFHP